MFSPTVQEYSDQRVDHSQHVQRKILISCWWRSGPILV